VFERPGWHVRLRFYRRWGKYKGLDDATTYTELANPEGPVVGVTFARLKLTQTFRFPDTPGEDPLEAAVNQLSAQHGVLFVVAAGNSGIRPQSIGSPGEVSIVRAYALAPR
jgi:hypothetical protein